MKIYTWTESCEFAQVKRDTASNWRKELGDQGVPPLGTKLGSGDFAYTRYEVASLAFASRMIPWLDVTLAFEIARSQLVTDLFQGIDLYREQNPNASRWLPKQLFIVQPFTQTRTDNSARSRRASISHALVSTGLLVDGVRIEVREDTTRAFPHQSDEEVCGVFSIEGSEEIRIFHAERFLPPRQAV